MGGYSEKSQINWLPMTIYSGSFLRFIMEDFGYVLGEGIIIVADDEIQAANFVTEYIQKTQGNGYRIASCKRQKKYPENFCCGLLVVNKYTNEQKIFEYLMQPDFLPVVVAGGLLPEYLRRQKYIFRLHKNENNIDFSGDVKEFKNYIIHNVPVICQVLKRIKSCIAITEYNGRKEYKKSFEFFYALGSVYAEYLRSIHSEREVVEFLKLYEHETLIRLEQIPDFASGEDIPETISALIWDFLVEHKNVIVADINNIDGEVYEAICNNYAVLFDTKFYYFSQELLMKMCTPLLVTMSEVELKKKLKSEGMISCNSCDYTVKKMICNVFGIRERKRFLWVQKDTLFFRDNLKLEDVFYNNNQEEL